MDSAIEVKDEQEKMEYDDKKPGCLGKCLRAISFGQYSTKLYYRGRDQHSSILGGIVTVVCGAIFSLLALYILYSTVFLKDNISMSEEIKHIRDDKLNITIGDYINEAMLGKISVIFQKNS